MSLQITDQQSALLYILQVMVAVFLHTVACHWYNTPVFSYGISCHPRHVSASSPELIAFDVMATRIVLATIRWVLPWRITMTL